MGIILRTWFSWDYILTTFPTVFYTYFMESVDDSDDPKK